MTEVQLDIKDEIVRLLNADFSKRRIKQNIPTSQNFKRFQHSYKQLANQAHTDAMSLGKKVSQTKLLWIEKSTSYMLQILSEKSNAP